MKKYRDVPATCASFLLIPLSSVWLFWCSLSSLSLPGGSPMITPIMNDCIWSARQSEKQMKIKTMRKNGVQPKTVHAGVENKTEALNVAVASEKNNGIKTKQKDKNSGIIPKNSGGTKINETVNTKKVASQQKEWWSQTKNNGIRVIRMVASKQNQRYKKKQ